MPEPFTRRLTGTCNRCGLCCQYEARDGSGLVRCGYLAVDDGAAGLDPIGTAGATQCLMHALRVDGMPIPMFYVRDMRPYGWRQCAKDSAAEDAIIIDRGIGRGCSLEMAR